MKDLFLRSAAGSSGKQQAWNSHHWRLSVFLIAESIPIIRCPPPSTSQHHGLLPLGMWRPPPPDPHSPPAPPPVCSMRMLSFLLRYWRRLLELFWFELRLILYTSICSLVLLIRAHSCLCFPRVKGLRASSCLLPLTKCEEAEVLCLSSFCKVRGKLK